MKRIFVSPWIAAAAALLLAGTAQAAPPVWNYNWTPTKSTVVTDDSPNTSYLKITDQLVNNQAQTFSTDIIATNITVVSDAPAGFPDEFITKGDISFNLRIFDGAVVDNIFQDFTFSGTFNTQDLANPSTVAIGDANVKFTNLTSGTITKTIGTHEYSVGFVSYTPPPPQGTKDSNGNPVSGAAAYHVTVRDLNIQKAPEPSSMILAGLGASFMGLGAWRKRRQLAAAEKA
jgi:hypothetical protein